MFVPWPAELVTWFIRLAEYQDYEKLWTAVLMLHFPRKDGYTVTTLDPDSSVLRCVVVKRRSKACLALSWEIWFRDPTTKTHEHDAMALRFWPSRVKLMTDVLPLFHAEGMALSYFVYPTRGIASSSSFRDPRNTKFDFYEEEAQNMFMERCNEARSETLRASSQSLNVEDVLSYLTKGEPVSIFRRVELVRASLFQGRGRKQFHTLETRTNTANAAPLESVNGDVSTSAPASDDLIHTSGHQNQQFTKSFPSDVILEIISFLPPHTLKALSLASSTLNALVAPMLWRTLNMHWDPVSRGQPSIDSLFSVLLRHASCIQTLSIRCSWIWTDERLCGFAKALEKLKYLSDLRLLLPFTYGPKVHLTCGGEYTPLFRLLADRGEHIRLQRFEAESIIRPNSPILSFLSTQQHIKELVSLTFTVDRIFTFPETFLPELESLVMCSSSVVSALVPGRKIERLALKAPRTDVSFLNALENSRASNLHVRISPWGTHDPSALYRELVGGLVRIPPKIVSLELGSCSFEPRVYLGLDRLTSLEYLRFWELIGSDEELRTWLDGLPSSLYKVEIQKTIQSWARSESGTWIQKQTQGYIEADE